MESCLLCIQRCFGLAQGSVYKVAKQPLISEVVLDTGAMGQFNY